MNNLLNKHKRDAGAYFHHKQVEQGPTRPNLPFTKEKKQLKVGLKDGSLLEPFGYLFQRHKSFQRVAETLGHVMNLLLIWKAKVDKTPLDISELPLPILVEKAKNILYAGARHLTKYYLAASAI